jgi:hypothetical protein
MLSVTSRQSIRQTFKSKKIPKMKTNSVKKSPIDPIVTLILRASRYAIYTSVLIFQGLHRPDKVTT